VFRFRRTSIAAAMGAAAGRVPARVGRFGRLLGAVVPVATGALDGRTPIRPEDLARQGLQAAIAHGEEVLPEGKGGAVLGAAAQIAAQAVRRTGTDSSAAGAPDRIVNAARLGLSMVGGGARPAEASSATSGAVEAANGRSGGNAKAGTRDDKRQRAQQQ